MVSGRLHREAAERRSGCVMNVMNPDYLLGFLRYSIRARAIP